MYSQRCLTLLKKVLLMISNVSPLSTAWNCLMKFGNDNKIFLRNILKTLNLKSKVSANAQGAISHTTHESLTNFCMEKKGPRIFSTSDMAWDSKLHWGQPLTNELDCWRYIFWYMLLVYCTGVFLRKYS